MAGEHCKTCTCGTAEYGAIFVGGVRDGQVIGPLSSEQIRYWNRHWWHSANLAIRIQPETTWRLATFDEIDEWNRQHARVASIKQP